MAGFEHLNRVIEKAKATQAVWEKEIARMKGMKFATICVHGGYTPNEAIRNNHGSIIEPVYSSTAQAYADSDWLEAALAYHIPAWGYTRIANPTVCYLETLLAMLEGYRQDFGTAACCTSSGMSAVRAATEPFIADGKPGEKMNFVAMAQCYGGTHQLFTMRYGRERSVDVRLVENAADAGEWAEKIDENTRFVYGEMPTNPGLQVFDVKAVAEIAHAKNAPLIVDSTIATPALLRPLEHGADVVVHSLTKSLTSNGRAIGGVLVSREDIVSGMGDEEMRKNFAAWAKLWPCRDHGPCLSPENASRTLDGVRALPSLIKHLSESAMQVAEFLESHGAVEEVNYLGLTANPIHGLAKRYLKLADTGENLYGHLLSFNVKGGAQAARRVLDRLWLVFRATDLGRIKSVATIPTISTHQQQGEEARKKAGIPSNLIRLCVGAEDPQDLIDELDRALKTAP